MLKAGNDFGGGGGGTLEEGHLGMGKAEEEKTGEQRMLQPHQRRAPTLFLNASYLH